jgi:DinB superfamily
MAKQITAADARIRIEPGWNQLNELLAGIPNDRVEEAGVNGDWSIKLMLGHIAYWERNAAQVIRLMANGQPLLAIDFNAINQQVAETDKHRSYDELRREFDAAHEALLAIIDETGAIDSRRLSWDTWGHYPEHIKQLEKWRKKAGV